MKIRKYIFICIPVILILVVLYYFLTAYRAEELDTWIGKYDYTKTYEHNDVEGMAYVIDYEIIIFKIDGDYYAKLTGDGWFTQKRSLGYVEGDNNSINIYFKENMPGDSLYQNGIDRYEEGELLITLSYVGSELHTSWHALRDAFLTLCDIEGEIEGVYFEKDL